MGRELFQREMKRLQAAGWSFDDALEFLNKVAAQAKDIEARRLAQLEPQRRRA